MRFPRSAAAIGAAAVGCLLVPVGAQAATRTVYMGTPPSAGKSLEKYEVDVDAFFPSTIKVHVNDKVAFTPVGFHNVDLPAKGGKAAALFAPTGKKIAGENDAAGQPFWFNGQDQLGFAPALLNMLYGKTVSYNGSKGVQSGLPLGDKLKPLTVKFTKKGSFTYYCDVHPGMKGKVQVVAAKSSAPSVKAVKSAVAKQVAKAVKTAKGLDKRTAPANTFYDGLHGSGGVEKLAFVPKSRTVKVGDVITFKMDSGSMEPHTASTGPGNIEDPKSYIGGIAAGFEGAVFPGVATYPSDPPPAGMVTLVPTLHGNGFWSSGVMDAVGASPLPGSSSVKIGAAGTYSFYCLIHPFMKATVTAS
jgi:plastocyanin